MLSFYNWAAQVGPLMGQCDQAQRTQNIEPIVGIVLKMGYPEHPWANGLPTVYHVVFSSIFPVFLA